MNNKHYTERGWLTEEDITEALSQCDGLLTREQVIRRMWNEIHAAMKIKRARAETKR